MKILHYTDRAQSICKSKIKPEPWLHIAVLYSLSDAENEHGSHDETEHYAIFVWDTRQVIDTGKIGQLAKWDGVPSAKDNHQPLKGKGDIVDAINAEIVAGDSNAKFMRGKDIFAVITAIDLGKMGSTGAKLRYVTLDKDEAQKIANEITGKSSEKSLRATVFAGRASKVKRDLPPYAQPQFDKAITELAKTGKGVKIQ